MDLDHSVLTVVVLMASGFAGGFVNAVAGGGSLLVFPTLVWVGLDPVTANVTNAVSLWPGYLSGVAAMKRDLAGTWERVRAWVVLSALAGLAGAMLLLVLPATTFERVVPALVAFASGLLLAQPALRRRSSSSQGTGHPRWLIPALVGAGVYGGYFGGVVGVLYLAIVSLSGVFAGAAVPAVKNLLQFTVNTVALVVFVASGLIVWSAVALVAPMTLLGGWVGGRTAARLRPDVLRWSVGVFGLVVAVYLLVR